MQYMLETENNCEEFSGTDMCIIATIAAENNHINIIQMLMECYDYDGEEMGDILYGAGKGGHMDMINFLLEKTSDKDMYDDVARGTAISGNIGLIKLMLNMGVCNHKNIIRLLKSEIK